MYHSKRAVLGAGSGRKPSRAVNVICLGVILCLRACSGRVEAGGDCGLPAWLRQRWARTLRQRALRLLSLMERTDLPRIDVPDGWRRRPAMQRPRRVRLWRLHLRAWLAWSGVQCP